MDRVMLKKEMCNFVEKLVDMLESQGLYDGNLIMDKVRNALLRLYDSDGLILRIEENGVVGFEKDKVQESYRHSLAAALCEVESDLFIGLTDCQSPIEKLIAIELFKQKQQQLILRYEPQYNIGGYRVDFAVWTTLKPLHQLITETTNHTGWKKLRLSTPSRLVKYVIECDGNEFHEKTPEQAARDKRQSNEIQWRGWKIFRFTGRQIWQDAKKVADEALNKSGVWKTTEPKILIPLQEKPECQTVR